MALREPIAPTLGTGNAWCSVWDVGGSCDRIEPAFIESKPTYISAQQAVIAWKRPPIRRFSGLAYPGSERVSPGKVGPNITMQDSTKIDVPLLLVGPVEDATPHQSGRQDPPADSVVGR